MDTYKRECDRIAAFGDRAVAIAALIAVLATAFCGNEPALPVAPALPTAQAPSARP